MKNKIFPFVAFGESIDNYLLFSFMYFLEIVNDSEAEIRSDVSINELFLEGYREDSFIAAFGLFQLNHGIHVDDSLLDLNVSLKELISRISKIPKMPTSDFRKRLSDLIAAVRNDVRGWDRKKWN